MKKIVLAAVILATFAACSNTQKTTVSKNKVEVLDIGSIYTKNGKAYNIFDDTLVNGVVKYEDNYYNDVEIVKYQNGLAVEVKEVSDGVLLKSITLNEQGKTNGLFYYDSGYDVIEGTVRNGLVQGSLKVEDDYAKTTKNYVNSILHGKSITVEDGKEVVTYYNMGQVVPNEKSVEKVAEITLDSNPESFANLEYKDGLYYGDDNKLFTGTAFDKYYSEYVYYDIKGGEVKTKFVYEENSIDGYGNSIMYFSPVSMTYYEGDVVKETLYDDYNGFGVFNGYKELDKDGNINGKVIEVYWDGSKLEKEVYNDKIMGKAVMYKNDGSIAEIHNYEEEAYNLVGYYNYENDKKRVIGGGIRNEDGFHRVGKWTWYFENGNIEQEIDFNFLDDYAYSKIYWENGNIKEEGKMTYCACYYLGEVKKYDENGVLSSIEIYDTEGNGELINNEDM